MIPVGRSGAGALLGLALSLLVSSPLLHAQTSPKRLSDWLLEQPATPDAYPLGLSWRVPEELSSQRLLFQSLSRELYAFGERSRINSGAVRRLQDWLRTLPVTGRVPVSIADARWLQANPVRDPVLQATHSVLLPSRPRTVTVVTERGERCRVDHLPGREAAAYAEACASPGQAGSDWAWIAQPDGRVQRYGIAAWNREGQDEPAPGAWIWAPARGSEWPERIAELLIRFLATQGPAPDPDRASAVVTPGTASRSRGLEVTSSDWGSVGLLQTPTARMARTGTFSFNLSRTQPYTQGNIFMQPVDWLEAGFRYTDISNRLYGSASNALPNGGQSNKDKSFDMKIRLWSESAWLPQLALGWRDLAGTGLFSGEYVVASKRTDALDWSVGLGTGYVGGRGNVRNPLGRINRSFNTRSGNVGQGGNVALGSYFRGPASLFGGVQYQSPWERWVLKLEYDGNNYQNEPQANNQKQTSPLNYGLVYRAARWLDLSLGMERGNSIMFGFTLHTSLDALEMPKLNDPARVPVATARPAKPPDWSATTREIALQTDWHVRKIEQRGRELRLSIEDAGAQYWRERVDRVAAVLHRDAPAAVDRFALVYGEGGTEVAEHVIDREAWVAQNLRPLPPSERREAVMARSVNKAADDTTLFVSPRKTFEAGLGFDYRQTLGGPDGFILWQVSAVERAKLRLRDDTWLEGSLRLGLYGNYDKFRVTGPSNLPRVRTFLREYLTTSKINMPVLQLTHVGKIGDNQYYSLYGGYLEDMFGGVGGEWLYRPFASRAAYGIDINAVKQRDFRQNFHFRDYQTVTGHATMYWDTGWEDVQANVSAGRYLAKDIGVTLDLSRQFRNGVKIGAFATRTNVSAAQFGEGSFDKGVYLSIPFDAMFTRSTDTNASFLWRPLTRDGGAKLARGAPLYGITGARDERAMLTAPAPRPNELSIPADKREAWSPKPEGPEPYVRIPPKATAAQWMSDSRHEYNLVEALFRQRFRNIQVGFDDSRRLNMSLSNEQIRPISRAVGRAARTALRLAPLETREINVTFYEGAEPVVTYEFADRERLERYMNGAISLKDLAGTIVVRYINPGARVPDPLARLDDLEPDEDPVSIGSLVATPRVVNRVARDSAEAARNATNVNWLQAGLVGAGLTVASSVFDRRADRFAKDHANNGWIKKGTSVGNALPWIGLGAAALLAFDGTDPQRSRTGYAATEAGAIAFLTATGLKYAVARARPQEELGNGSFRASSTNAGTSSFPSRHAVVAWAVATPFAKEYGADWLYGAAVLTNLARVGSREHWVSDTVAGALIGYGIGQVFWESSRSRSKDEPRVLLNLSGVKLAWEW